MGAFSIWHIVVIAIVAAFLFFGWKQLPDMARSFGRSLRVFKTEMKGLTEDDKARESGTGAQHDAAATPRPIESRPAERPVEWAAAPRAEVVRNPAAASRPRPTPSPNGRTGGN